MMLYPRSAGPTDGASRGSRSNRPAALPQVLQDEPLVVAAAAVMVVAAVEQQPAKLVLDQPPGVNTAQASILASTRLLLQNMTTNAPVLGHLQLAQTAGYPWVLLAEQSPRMPRVQQLANELVYRASQREAALVSRPISSE